MSEHDHIVQKQELPPPDRSAELRAASGFGLSALASVALGLTYFAGGQPQLEGVFLALALGGLGFGFAVWGRKLLPQGPAIEEREVLPTSGEDKEEFTEDLSRGGVIERRKLLTRSLGVAGLALVGAALFPIRSLGQSPGRSLFHTAWRRGSRLVDEDGRPVRADEVAVGSLLTVFPEGHPGAGDAQAVLVRVEPGQNRPRPGRQGWDPDGLLAYSKVCTHAGCPVGLYQADTHVLLCPCHQSAFKVLDGARPSFGPATRSLPQLPLTVSPDGFVVAMGDFSNPVGPGFWNMK